MANYLKVNKQAIADGPGVRVLLERIRLHFWSFIFGEIMTAIALRLFNNLLLN